MSGRVEGCRACAETTSGDCGGHGTVWAMQGASASVWISSDELAALKAENARLKDEIDVTARDFEILREEYAERVRDNVRLRAVVEAAVRLRRALFLIGAGRMATETRNVDELDAALDALDRGAAPPTP